MNHCAKHILKAGWLAGLLLGLTVTSCTDLIFDNRDGCERGVYVNFVYDYNLHRSDLFADHVGEVTLYALPKPTTTSSNPCGSMATTCIWTFPTGNTASWHWHISVKATTREAASCVRK